MLRLSPKLLAEIRISNVVATADLNQSVDLTKFQDFPYLSGNLRLYNCGYVKNKNMIGRVTIFRTGKMISVGTKSIETSTIELNKAKNLLLKYKLIKRCHISPKVRNIVSLVSLEKKIHLITLARNLHRGIYEPDQFPGLIYNIYGSISCLIFASGNLIITGSKSYNELNSALFEIKRIIEKYER